MTGVHFDGVGNGAGNFISGRSFTQKFDVFRPGQSDERPDSGFGAGIKKPARGAVINPNNVKPGCRESGRDRARLDLVFQGNCLTRLV